MKELKSFKKISSKNKYKDNPRTITKRKFELLKKHIEDLGDLGGIVYCHKNKAFVSGNMRSEILNGSDIKIIEKLDDPTRKGTVAYGFVFHKEEMYSYREVYFTESRFKMACIVANNDGGDFDYDVLANKFDEIELNKIGLKVWSPIELNKSIIGKSILIGFNHDDITKAKELVKFFKENDVYIGGELLEKLQSLKK